jgi:2,3-bisphosphoglycerate-dependent phosphoglycerate mutase
MTSIKSESPKLVLIGHGGTEWKKLNLFEGCVDSTASEQGLKEAIQGGKLLKEGGYMFNVCYTSIQKTSIYTTFTILDELDQLYIPIIKNLNLNDRHFDDIEEKDITERAISYFKEVIFPDIKSGKNVLVVAHGDTLRNIIKYLDNMSEQEFIDLQIPNAIPLVYEFGNDLRPKKSYYLSYHETINDKVKSFYFFDPDLKVIFAEKINKQQESAVWEILKKTNNDFVPPLTERMDTVHDITPEEQEKPEKNETNEEGPVKVFEDLKDNTFMFIVKNGKIEGFFSLRKDYALEINEETIICDYIIAVIIDPNCRNRGHAKKMYNILLNERKEKNIATRTWSTNYAHIHILDILGFKLVQRILNNRGPNIDTVYFLKKQNN